MLDKLYENIGEKIKNWAKWLFILEAISAVVGGFVLIGNDDLVLGLCVLLTGPFVAWVSTWLLYAFGQLVDDVHASRNSGDTTALQRVKTEAPPALQRVKTEAPPAKPLVNTAAIKVQYQSGACELCGTASEQLVYCKIVDDLGTRYRTICENCMVKHGATPQT